MLVLRAGQTLAGAEVKGNVGPAPVIDQQLHGDEGFGLGIRRNARLRAIGGHAFSAADALAILAADRPGQHVFRTHGLDGMQDLALLVADGVGLE